MAKHEHPQQPAPVFYPAGHPKSASVGQAPKPPTPAPSQVENTAPQASVQSPSGAQDLGEIIRGIQDLAQELADAFFAVPGITDNQMRVDPEKFDTATRYAFVACGNALDYAIRLVTEKGRALRILKLRRELADEMRAAGITGDPTGESPMGKPPEQVG